MPGTAIPTTSGRSFNRRLMRSAGWRRPPAYCTAYRPAQAYAEFKSISALPLRTYAQRVWGDRPTYPEAEGP
jgi:hypothetical protein